MPLMTPDPDPEVMSKPLQIRMASAALVRLGIDLALYDLEAEFDSSLHYDENWRRFKKKHNIREPYELPELEREQLEEKMKRAEELKTYRGIYDRYPEWIEEYRKQHFAKFGTTPAEDAVIRGFHEALKEKETLEPLVRLLSIDFTFPPIDVPGGYFFYHNPRTDKYFHTKDTKLIPITPTGILRELKVVARPPPPAPPAPPLAPLPSYEEMLLTERAGLVHYGDILWRKYEEIKKKRPDFLTLKETWPVEDVVVAYEKEHGEVRL